MYVSKTSCYTVGDRLRENFNLFQTPISVWLRNLTGSQKVVAKGRWSSRVVAWNLQLGPNNYLSFEYIPCCSQFRAALVRPTIDLNPSHFMDLITHNAHSASIIAQRWSYHSKVLIPGREEGGIVTHMDYNIIIIII